MPVRRRGVLHIGVTGLAAMLVQACSEGSTTTPPAGSSSPTGSPAGSGGPSAASTFDPSGYVPAAVPLAELKKLYNYDKGSTLNAELTDRRTGDGIVLEDITYSDTRGNDAIPAYVVGPENFTGRLPAIVFGSGPDGDRDALLNEATAIARRNALVMVTSLPIKPTADPVADARTLSAAVVAQRRAFDLLIRRTDCDGSRVGYAGHHSGAALGAVLLGLESRITGAVLARDQPLLPLAGQAARPRGLARLPRLAEPLRRRALRRGRRQAVGAPAVRQDRCGGTGGRARRADRRGRRPEAAQGLRHRP